MSLPIKVVHLIPSIGPGGAETMLCNLLGGMSRERFASVVISTSTQNEPAMEERVRCCTTAYHPLGTNSTLKPGTIRRIAALLKQERPHVVQTWMHKADFAGGIAGRLARCPVVSGIHSLGLFVPAGANRIGIRLLNTALSFGAKFLPSHIVSCSQTAIDTHAARGYPRRKMLWIGNGIDTARFRPNMEAGLRLRMELGIPQDAPVVGFVGRMAPVKDVPTFLRAAARLQQSMPHAHCVLCGPDMDPGGDVGALLALLPRPDHVHFIPFRQDIENVYPAFTLMAMTSQSEAYPMVLIEAMACGVPCTSTDAGDAAAIIDRSGAIAARGDDAGVAATWLDLLRRSRGDLRLLSDAVRAGSEARFSLRMCVQQYEELYTRIAAARGYATTQAVLASPGTAPI